MSRRIVLSLSLACLFLIGALAVSCGSSNSSSKACTGGPYNVVGNWQLTVTDTGGSPVTLYGAIDSAGLALFFDNSVGSSGDTAELPALTGTCSFSGNINAYAEPGGPNSGSSAVDPAQGNVTSNSAFGGNFTGAASGTFSAASFSPLTGAVTPVSGNKTGAVQGALNLQPVLLPATFTPGGSNNSTSFTTSNTLENCTVTGTFTEVGTNNVFDVSITFSGTGCAITGTFTGIGFEASTDYFDINGGHADTYLYADILDGTNTFVIEFF
ncbi:MAG TPA: hypothetical protein VKF84_00845 [Candidatus Sulfotelmatobacter sp.]|nr:hypothetical protein [Candidatus Sulfotelmatobacter sp.]